MVKVDTWCVCVAVAWVRSHSYSHLGVGGVAYPRPCTPKGVGGGRPARRVVGSCALPLLLFFKRPRYQLGCLLMACMRLSTRMK